MGFIFQIHLRCLVKAHFANIVSAVAEPSFISSIETKISPIILESVSYKVSLISWNLIVQIVFLPSGLNFNPFSSVYNALRFWDLKGVWQWRTAEWGGERNRLILKPLSRIRASSEARISNRIFQYVFLFSWEEILHLVVKEERSREL